MDLCVQMVCITHFLSQCCSYCYYCHFRWCIWIKFVCSCVRWCFFSAVLFFVCSFSFGKFNIRHIASMLYQSKFSKKKPAYSTSTSHRSVRFNRAFGSTLEASLRYGIFDIFTGVKCLYIFTYIYDEYTTTNATLNNEQHKRKRKRKRKKTNSNHKLINAH